MTYEEYVKTEKEAFLKQKDVEKVVLDNLSLKNENEALRRSRKYHEKLELENRELKGKLSSYEYEFGRLVCAINELLCFANEHKASDFNIYYRDEVQI